jgi:hypothetical protein
VIKLIRRFFEETLQWTHGVEVLVIAYQNKVAHAMKGWAIHTACNVCVDLQPRQLSHTDVDVLFTRNQDLKFVLADEVGMISDHLLGSAAVQLDDASNRPLRYKVRRDGSQRTFGGYNLLMPSDFLQLAPCPPGGPLFTPLGEYDAAGSKQERARAMKEMFWRDDMDALNYFIEMNEQKVLQIHGTPVSSWNVAEVNFLRRTIAFYTVSRRSTVDRGRRKTALSVARNIASSSPLIGQLKQQPRAAIGRHILRPSARSAQDVTTSVTVFSLRGIRACTSLHSSVRPTCIATTSQSTMHFYYGRRSSPSGTTSFA